MYLIEAQSAEGGWKPASDERFAFYRDALDHLFEVQTGPFGPLFDGVAFRIVKLG